MTFRLESICFPFLLDIDFTFLKNKSLIVEKEFPRILHSSHAAIIQRIKFDVFSVDIANIGSKHDFQECKYFDDFNSLL